MIYYLAYTAYILWAKGSLASRGGATYPAAGVIGTSELYTITTVILSLLFRDIYPLVLVFRRFKSLRNNILAANHSGLVVGYIFPVQLRVKKSRHILLGER